MKVFKFGGASVKNAKAVINVGSILQAFQREKLVVVVSAMGKMTNHLEALLAAESALEQEKLLGEFKSFHLDIAGDLNCESEFLIRFEELVAALQRDIKAIEDPFHRYDSIVSYGELCSTTLIATYLKSTGLKCEWLDARNVIKTELPHKNTSVNWPESEKNVSVLKSDLKEKNLLITQGFIASNMQNETTTLGREGSDFSAAIFAFLLDAEDVTIWKDVPGMLNADPKWFENTVKLNQLSYREAIELAYYGASVIHPKTVQPLQNKNIPLYVKSFLDYTAEGTVIKAGVHTDPEVSSYIFKTGQALISFVPKDFSFVGEDHLRDIFSALAKYKTRVHLMQNSAVSFSIVIDFDPVQLQEISDSLKDVFQVKFNSDLELLTIRHYDDNTIKKLTAHKKVLLEQRSRHTLRLVLAVLQS